MLTAPFAFGRRRGGSKKNRVAISEPINDARLRGIVWGHLHLYSITDCQTNKAFAHPAGDMRKNKALVRKRDAKHRPWKHRHDGAFHFDGFFRIHGADLLVAVANSAAQEFLGRAEQSIPALAAKTAKGTPCAVRSWALFARTRFVDI
jgi:hypothetical protein